MTKFLRNKKLILLVLFFMILLSGLWFIWRLFSSNVPAFLPPPSSKGEKANKKVPEVPKIKEKPGLPETASKDSLNRSHKGKVIVLDPGHQKQANLDLEPIGPGSSQMKEKVRGGTSGVVSGTPEYEITLQVSLKLKTLLEEAGAKVLMTRDRNDVDISNAERTKMANDAQADLFVRIHADGNQNQSISGISTLYPARNSWTETIYLSSLRAAQLIQQELIRNTGRKDKGVVARGDITGFNWSKVPVVLVEAGFLTNSEEDGLLNNPDFQQGLAQGIFNGIERYLEGE